MFYTPPPPPPITSQFEVIVEFKSAELRPEELSEVFLFVQGDFMSTFTSNYSTLLAQGKAIYNAPGYDTQTKLIHFFQDFNRVLPGMNTRPDVMTAFALACGFTSVDVGTLYFSKKIISDPQTMLMVLQSSGMCPNQINAALGTMGGAYAGMMNKTLSNVVVQNAVNLAVSALNPIESGLRSSTQAIVSNVGEPVIKTVTTVTNALNPSNW